MRWLAIAALGCASEAARLQPVLDVPDPGSPAYPYDAIDEWTLSIAQQGDVLDLERVTAGIEQLLTLRDVAPGNRLVVHLAGRSRGVEVAYGRTCAFNLEARAPPPSLHLYFSRSVKWGAMLDAAPRAGACAVTLASGRAVWFGGDVLPELFDPSTGTFAQLDPVRTRSGAACAAMADGERALLVGGTDASGDAVPTAELHDPLAAPGRQVERADGPALVDHAAVSLVDGSVLVAGGRGQEAAGAPFVTTNGAWRVSLGEGGALSVAQPVRGGLAMARASHAMIRLGDEPGADVLVIGGRDAIGQPVATTEVYRPLRGSFEVLAGAELLTPRWNHQAVRLPGGFVLVIGGVTRDAGGSEVAVSALELYDPIVGGFTPAGELPAGAGVTAFSVTPLPDGRVLVAGGRDASGAATALTLIARLDPIGGAVDLSATDPLPSPRAGHGAALLCDGTAVVGGGEVVGAPAARYNPPSAGRR